MKSFDEQMMRLALEEAEKARAEGEIPVGAVIVRGEKVIARAHNTREQACDPTGHAELNALRQAAKALGGWRLTGCTLYVTLEPCPMCAGLLAQTGLDAIVFGARDRLAGCCGSVYDLPEDEALPYGKTPSSGGLLESECAQILQDFFRARRKNDA